MIYITIYITNMSFASQGTTSTVAEKAQLAATEENT